MTQKLVLMVSAERNIDGKITSAFVTTEEPDSNEPNVTKYANVGEALEVVMFSLLKAHLEVVSLMEGYNSKVGNA